MTKPKKNSKIKKTELGKNLKKIPKKMIKLKKNLKKFLAQKKN